MKRYKEFCDDLKDAKLNKTKNDAGSSDLVSKKKLIYNPDTDKYDDMSYDEIDDYLDEDDYIE